MRIEQAEELLKFRKAQGPVSEPLTFHTDEGIALTLLPPGNARGCFSDLMRQLGAPLSVRPKLRPGALYIGEGTPHVFIKVCQRFLWPQEYYVFVKEMRNAVQRAMMQLDSGPVLPRRGEGQRGFIHSGVAYDPMPYPEDFHLLPLGVFWHEEGKRDVPARELASVKKEFEEVLQHFIEEH